MLAQLFALLPLLALISASPVVKRESSRLIESGRVGGLCLSVEGGRAAVAANKVTDGTPVVTLNCAIASYWDISRGSGSVIVSGTGYALDIGLTPGNNGALKTWTSYPTAPQQTWYLTGDNRIAQTGGNQCLDQGDNGPQTYECTTGNTNQVWNVRFNDPTPSASSSVSASASASISSSSSGPSPSSSAFNVLPNVPVVPVIPDTPGNGQRIRPVGRLDVCATVDSGYAAINTPVGIAACFADGYNWADLQTWDLPAAGTTGVVRLHGHPTLCLDAGDNPANGSGVKVYTCGQGWPQQQWELKDNTLRTANNQCFNIRKESGPTNSKPIGKYIDTQTWECSTNGDPYQAFQVLV